MKFFLDTEFIDNGKTIDLISIGIVAENGAQFYAVNLDCNYANASDWVEDNVLNPIGLSRDPEFAKQLPESIRPMPRWEIKNRLVEFINQNSEGKPEFWGYYCDYDWVVLCQLFGRMIDLPKGWPMYCLDLKQECYRAGDPRLPRMDSGTIHHALDDAKEIKMRFDWLAEYVKQYQP